MLLRVRALIAATGTLGPWEVGVAPGRETIMLRDSPKQVAGHTHRGQLLDYSDTTETIQLRAEMAVINDFLAHANITLDGRAVVPPHLCRQFQMPASSRVPTFELHGRLYGGFWINMHREDRHRIGIKGEQPIDLDFTAMFTAIAYALVGQGAVVDDPYDDIEGLELAGINDRQRRASVRGAIKRGLNAMYFRKGPMTRLPSEVKKALGPGWTAGRFTKALRQRHAAIASLFEAGVGLKLMYIESKIMVCFLLRLVDLNVPALPIHDGALVACSDRGVALAAMGEASASVLGVPLPVKAKPLPGSLHHHRANCPPMP